MTNYRARPVKRLRNSNEELAVIDAAIVRAVNDDAPVTLRGVFYRVVSAGYIAKTERGYQIISRELLKLRRNGTVDYQDITDGSRITYRPDTWNSVDEMLEDASSSYRRALWHGQPDYVEILSEKDAITGAILPVTQEWDVSLDVVRGYSSETFAWRVARGLYGQMLRGKTCYLYQLGDHDPSGVDAWRSFQVRVLEFLVGWDVDTSALHFERLAVTPEQIISMNLPTRPTKQSDMRSKGFHGESVEVDAIPASMLRSIVREAIEQHIPADALTAEREQEAREREGIAGLVGLVT